MASFASTFGVSEFALTVSDDVASVGIVSGSSVYYVGWQWKPLYESAELTVLTNAELKGRRLALSRLQQQAEQFNAHGVLDVCFRQLYREKELLEVTAVGTAVRLTQGKPPPRPFLSTLTASEFWTLRRAGFRPYGIALGLCVRYHVASVSLQRLWMAQRTGQIGRRQISGLEFMEYTEAAQSARQTAISRAEAEGSQGLAEGILNLIFDQSVTAPRVTDDNRYRRHDRIVRVVAQGTSIISHRDRWPSLDYGVPLNH